MRLNDDYIYSDTLIHGGKYIDKYRSKKTGKWIYVYTKAGYTRPEKAHIKGDRLSKTTGYGPKAMKYSIKSDKVAAKAARTRKKLSNNKAYISMMDRKVSSLSPEKYTEVKKYIDSL